MQEFEKDSNGIQGHAETPIDNGLSGDTGVSIDKKELSADDEVTVTRAELNNKIDKIDQKFDELNRDKISFITVSGIFVAIFTFVSIEVQIFRYICDFYKIIGFTFVFSGVLLLFIVLLDYVARSWVDNSSKNKTGIVVIIIISTLLMWQGLENIKKSNVNWTCEKDLINSPINVYNNLETKIPDNVKIDTE